MYRCVNMTQHFQSEVTPILRLILPNKTSKVAVTPSRHAVNFFTPSDNNHRDYGGSLIVTHALRLGVYKLTSRLAF